MKRRSSCGVTLLEVLIALGLTALVTGLVFGGGPALSKRFVDGRFQQTARALAWKKLAELETDTIRTGKQSGAFGGEFPEFRYELAVEPARLGKTLIEGLYQVSLRIARVDRDSREAELLTTQSLVYDKFQ